MGIEHRMITPRYDEPAFDDGSIEDHVQMLAQGKAESLMRDFPSAIIIGADQLCVVDYDVLGKPGSLEKAKEQLTLLQGRSHRLVNGLSIIYKGKRQVRLEEAFLTMRELTGAEIDFYLKKDNPIEACGSYLIEGMGLSLFTKIQTRDINTITGLPTCLLMEMLTSLGFTNLA